MMSLKKCSTQPSTCLFFIGIVFDTNRRTFEVPETKLETLETLLTEALQNRFIAFHDLEKNSMKMSRHEYRLQQESRWYPTVGYAPK